VRFSQTPARGPVSFRANRTYSFADGNARRLILMGDVSIQIAGINLRSRRAAVWSLTRPDRAVQIFVFLDQFGAPEESVAGAAFSSDQLPVKAVVIPDGGIRLVTDRLEPSAPTNRSPFPDDAAFMTTAETAFAKALLREVDPAAAAGESSPAPAQPLLDARMADSRKGERQARRDAGIEDPWYPATTGPAWRLSRQQDENSPSPASRSATGPIPSTPSTPSTPRSTPRSSSIPRSTTAQAPPRPSEPVSGATPAPAPVGTNPAATSTTPATSTTATDSATRPSLPIGPAASGTASAIPPPAFNAGSAPIFAPRGTIVISPQNLTYVSGEEENSLIATGGVTVQYTETMGRVLQMTAQRVVVFLEPGEVERSLQYGVESVRGIYLEGDVQATDGRYTLRAPQMYYDVRANRAVSIDAVFWTYDEVRKLPLYVRAQTISQEAAAQFSAKRATLTNSAFFDPELTIGASAVTITRQTVQPARKGEIEAPEAKTRTIVDAKNIVPRLAGLPVFWWPSYKGDPDRFPVKDLRIENFSGSGAAIKTTLDIYSLVGLEKSRKFQADLLADFYVERGIALGTDLGWESDNAEGRLFAWGLPGDRGIDVMKPGTRINRDDEFRGVLLGEHRQKLDEKWTLLAEASLLSDEAVIDAFFEGLGESRREFTNRLAARRIDRNTLLSAEVKGSATNFVSNEYLLQSQGYSVDKLPEFVYKRLGDDLIRSQPGLLTYFSEYRAGIVQMNFDDVDARDHGLSSNRLSQRALGIDFDEKLSDSLAARGYIEDPVFRADTRHEVNLSTNAGPVKVNPFVVARGTAYDEDFEAYSGDNADSGRVWSAAGVRVSTTVQRVYESVDSRVFDLHRLRHIIEPNATFWAGGTTLESQYLPTYDQRVEELADGSMIKVGATQTFQTQRGAPGEWHNTDVLTITTDYLWSSDDTTRRGPLGRFVDYRPELSNAGEFFISEAAWRTTDALTLTGSSVYDVDASQQAMTALGLMILHSPQFSTVTALHYLNEQESTILTLGARYELTSKYDFFFGADYDTDEGGFETTSFEVQRRFPSAVFGVGLSYNDITGETSFAFVFRPWGASGEGRFSGLGSRNATSSTGGF
jgi:hypothetical protein